MTRAGEVVLDASALIAMLWEEPGGDRAESLADRAVVSTVNWTEVLQRFQRGGLSLDGKQDAIEALGIRLEPYTTEDADAVARMWDAARPARLSLADRACLALARRLGVPAHTADRVWADLDVGVEVVLIR